MSRCPELAIDVLKILRGVGNKKVVDPKTLPKCNFHAHEAGQKCDFDREILGGSMVLPG
jgi:hypothetical protein